MTAPLHRLLPLARCLTAAAALASAATGWALATTVSVEDPRPVAAALDEIQQASGLPVTYEDPPFVFRTTVARAAEDRSLIPRGGTLAFDLPAAATLEATFGAARRMVTSYNAQHGAATFSVVRDANFVHVVPREALGISGLLEPVAPVLDTRITLPAKPRTGLDLLEDICKAVSAADGRRVEIGMVPANALTNQEVDFGASAAPARDVLAELLVANVTPLTWRLLYDPQLKTYYLNVPLVSP
jgi:hypothetical protein